MSQGQVSEARISNTSFVLALLGMGLVVAGTFFPAQLIQKHFFFSGTVLLTLSAVLRRRWFFIALEIVLLTGTVVAYLPVAALFKAGLPLAIAVPVLYWSGRQGALASTKDRVGALGIVILAAGYAVSHWSLYLVGDLVILWVSWLEFRGGVREALVWVILNGVFALGVLASWREARELPRRRESHPCSKCLALSGPGS